MKALRIELQGAVQGVGFRPWVYKLAQELDLKGFVCNTSYGAAIEVAGARYHLKEFLSYLQYQRPEHCFITHCHITPIGRMSYLDFRIIRSKEDHPAQAVILPDIATCPECLKEVLDPNNRRYQYPFTNCTHCGPRYSIINTLPYDRVHTSMHVFPMCPSCQQEYEDANDRRFHAQPNACHVCGPHVELVNQLGKSLVDTKDAIEKTAKLILQGHIVAIKGLGGFRLVVDATNHEAVKLLRVRKGRPVKPFALMMANVSMVQEYVELSQIEKEALESVSRPIILLRKKENQGQLSSSVALDNPYLGCMLPSMPLEHLLMQHIGRPVIATSGNFSEEPICIDNNEAYVRLGKIADYFLVHNRSIVRQVDDSIVQEIHQEISILRRARGYAPIPLLTNACASGLLALGAHQKNTVSLGIDKGIVVSQHIGDLDNEISIAAFEKTVDSLRAVYPAKITQVVCDLHPDYASSKYAQSMGVEVLAVQHHHAHVAACKIEHGIEDDVLGICWDGTGWGLDRTIWGGEFLICHDDEFKRLATLRNFRLPSGDTAVKEPRRTAIGLLYELGDGNLEGYYDLDIIKQFTSAEIGVLVKLMKENINAPYTSSMGRLFDGISALLGLCGVNTFEGQAASSLEYQALSNSKLGAYSYQRMNNTDGDGYYIDWHPLLRDIINDHRRSIPVAHIATRFHHALIEMIVDVVYLSKLKKVILTGGCFQNKFLLEGAIQRLKNEGFQVYWPKKFPANDGGVSLGQAAVAVRLRKSAKSDVG